MENPEKYPDTKEQEIDFDRISRWYESETLSYLGTICAIHGSSRHSIYVAFVYVFFSLCRANCITSCTDYICQILIQSPLLLPSAIRYGIYASYPPSVSTHFGFRMKAFYSLFHYFIYYSSIPCWIVILWAWSKIPYFTWDLKLYCVKIVRRFCHFTL